MPAVRAVPGVDCSLRFACERTVAANTFKPNCCLPPVFIGTLCLDRPHAGFSPTSQYLVRNRPYYCKERSG